MPRWPPGRFEMIRKIEIERFSLTTSKPFDEVVAVLNAGIGHPDMVEFGRSTHDARSFAELKSAVEKGLSKVGLMLFMQLDQGAVMRKELGRGVPKIVRLIIGNPLIMKEMAKHVREPTIWAQSGLKPSPGCHGSREPGFRSFLLLGQRHRPWLRPSRRPESPGWGTPPERTGRSRVTACT